MKLAITVRIGAMAVLSLFGPQEIIFFIKSSKHSTFVASTDGNVQPFAVMLKT